MQRSAAAPIQKVGVSTYVIPTESPEADGTIEWNSTTLVLVEIEAGGMRGIGYTYASRASAAIIHDVLAREITGISAFDIPAVWEAMIRSVRNLGGPGAGYLAISAVDLALWDLKARLLNLPLARLLGMARDAVPIYGSGGFTSYSVEQLQNQLWKWKERGIGRVKMKVGSHPEEDIRRVQAARLAIGAQCELYLDANGAYSPKQALKLAEAFDLEDVKWFEEPVSSDDLEGLHFIRERAPLGMDIAAGEYGYNPVNLRRLLEAGSVDVLQIDATRCLGLSGFMQSAALSLAHFTDISSHCAPSVHVALGCALPHLRHIEYFSDHARIERMFFDGAIEPVNGMLAPDLSRIGLGLEFKLADAREFAA